MDNTQQTSAVNTDDGKTIAIINKTPLAAYHLRQTLALFIISLGLWAVEMILVLIPVIGVIVGILMIFVYLALFVFWIIGLIAAVNGQEKPMPVFGVKAQDWFKNIK